MANTKEKVREVGRKQMSRSFASGGAFLLFLQAAAGAWVSGATNDFYMLLGYSMISLMFIAAVAICFYAAAYLVLKTYNK